MASPILLGLFVLLRFNSVLGETCGGLLEGETGHFSFGIESNQEKAEILSSACLWIIQLHYETDIQFTLNGLSMDNHLHLYSEDQLTSCSLLNYTTLTSTQVGSSSEYPGKTLIVVMPNSSASVAFSWHFAGNDYKSNSVATMKNSDYIISPNGLLEWEQLETAERVTWGIDPTASFFLRWDVEVATPFDSTDSCASFYFGIFQLTSQGFLSEAVSLTCGQSSKGKLEGISRRAVVLIKINTNVDANKVTVSWGHHDQAVTKPPVTEPPVTETSVTETPVTESPVTESPVTTSPVPTATGLFAATDEGLIALDLQTLEATALSSQITHAVAVNPNISKVYWSEGEYSSRILRSNLDGTAKEIIIPPTGDNIFMLAIEKASGNIYFALALSDKITVCDAFGKNCATVVSNPSVVKRPVGIALDSENGVMYWGNGLGLSTNYLVRANLDGSNATIISTGFKGLCGITLDHPSNDVIYWVDRTDHTIGSIDVNGGNKQTLVEFEYNQYPWGIQIDAQKVYFGDVRSIQSVDRNSGKQFTTLFNSTGFVYHLAFYNVPINQS